MQPAPVTTLRQKTYQMFEDNMQTSPLARKLNVVLMCLIIVNVIAVIFESDQAISERFATGFFIFEAVSVAIFTIEFGLRIWSCVASRFACRPLW
jgi:voltage-gated potassium channel